MRTSLFDRAKAAISSKQCVAAMAIVPLAAVAAKSARATPTILFGFSNASVSANGGSFTSGGTFQGTTLDNGSIHIVGSRQMVGDSGGSGGSSSSSGGSFGSGGAFGYYDIQFIGPLSPQAPPDVSDLVNAIIALNASSNGAPVTYLGSILSANGIPVVSDTSSPPNFSGQSVNISDTLSAPASIFAASGSWTLDVGLLWPDSAPTDTLTITAPDNSVDVGVNITPTPEPCSAALLLAPVWIAGTRRRRRLTG
jgi:hypothetical protein